MRKEIMIKTTSVYDPRSLAELVGIANEYVSSVALIMDNRSVNAKSIMGVMGLGLDQGKVITIEANGNDEAEVVNALEKFLSR